MIDFKKIQLRDKEWIKPLLIAADVSGCHQNFTNLFAWTGHFHYQVAQIKDYLVVKGRLGDGEYYFYPAGTSGVAPVLEALYEDAQKSGYPFRLLGLSRENRLELSRLYPDSFKFSYLKDSSDYVYYLEKLVSLKGSKLQAKRNHINYFRRQYRDNWSFELINAGNLEECREMNRQWCREHNCEEDAVLESEYCAVRRCFDNYFELELEGGLLRAEGRIIAFTMGERLNSDTYVIHVEKAFDSIRGSYQMINQQFALHINRLYPHLVFMNREEDMGYEGLRQAKLSYRPDKMEDKYAATLLRWPND